MTFFVAYREIKFCIKSMFVMELCSEIYEYVYNIHMFTLLKFKVQVPLEPVNYLIFRSYKLIGNLYHN